MIATLLLAMLAPPVPVQELETFLRDRMGYSDSDLAKVERGDVVTRKLERATDKEVALVGVVRMPGSQERFLERFRNIESFMRSEELTRVGRFGVPPAPEDLAELPLLDDDYSAMRDCRSGNCDVKLSAARIAELRAMDWSAPDHRERLAELARGWLSDYVRGYRENGNQALVVYDDRDEPQSLGEGFSALLEQSPYLFEYLPELHHYLEDYPRTELPGSEDLLFWAVEDFGLKPLTTVSHATIYRGAQGTAPQTTVALKQIYASHYFHAALKLMTLVETDVDSAEGFYLVYLDRSLFDTKIGGLRRRIVEGRLEDNLRSRLESIRRQVAEPG